MRDFLLTSLVLSVVLTVALNVLPRLFPSAARKAEERVLSSFEPEPGQTQEQGSRVKVFFPWKAMLAVSLGLTLLLNLGRLF